MTRDSQRAKVYGAEHFLRRLVTQHQAAGVPFIEIAGSQIAVPDEMLFGSLDGVRTYLRHVERQDWFQALWPNHSPVEVKQRRNNNKAHYRASEHTLYLHDTEVRGQAWAMREMVVLHEMAHAVTMENGGWCDIECHGPEFAAAFVALVRNQVGDEAGWLLSYVLQTNDVSIDHRLYSVN